MSKANSRLLRRSCFAAVRNTQRDIQKALMVFQSLNGLAPEYLSSKFMCRSDAAPYTLLDFVNKLTIPRTNCLRNRYCGAVLLNSIPQTLMQAESLTNFRTLF